MELSLRTFLLTNRLVIRRPLALKSFRYITGPTALKANVNIELLNSFNQDIKEGAVVPVFRRALLFPSRVALQDDVGIYTYAGLHQAAAALSKEIAIQLVGEKERTISYMCSNDASHVIVQWAIWMSGNIAVPLTPIHPPNMLKFFLADSASKLIICSQEYENKLRSLSLELSIPLLTTRRDKEITAQLYQPDSTFVTQTDNGLTDVGKSNRSYKDLDALIIYTSGTTNKPKGVVWSHSMLSSQIAALQSAWQYSASDVVLHTLPLHHIHGQLNSLNASLASGARIRMLQSFTPHTVWARLLGMGEIDETKVTVFHGVPAMYARLAAEHERMFADKRTAEYVRMILSSRMRLMCAGSAPLPNKLYHKWEQISGIRLLERYGMSEVGMALSNPYQPPEERTVGCVGLPLPGVSVRIADTELRPTITVECEPTDNQICLNRLGISTTKDVYVESNKYGWSKPKITENIPSKEGIYEGELQLKGPAVFKRYWNRSPDLLAADFTKDGWFRTGDSVSFSENKFRILGRTSIDIIKTGGYKVSALQVESAILEHPKVADVAVIGMEDEVLGQIVIAIVVVKDNAKLTLQELREESGKRLAPYQLPKNMLILDEMPRNAMGKLDKKVIKNVVLQKLGKKSEK